MILAWRTHDLKFSNILKAGIRIFGRIATNSFYQQLAGQELSGVNLYCGSGKYKGSAKNVLTLKILIRGSLALRKMLVLVLG